MLGIDLNGKRAFIAGVADDRGYGWAIAKALAAAGAKICVGTWPPTLGIFQKSLDRNKLDVQLADGSSMVIEKTYPLDAVFDLPADVPADIREDKRYKELAGYTIGEVAEQIKADFGGIDIVIHSLANGPEVKNALLETSRQGYLAALSASAFSLVSMVQRFGPMMPKGGAVASLSYLAAVRTVPGYGGGMSSAKAALESDTRTLAYEAGRKWGVRINTISAGPLASRAAKAIGTIEKTVDYYADNSPLGECNSAEDVGNTVAFLVSPLAAAITGATIYVDKGYNTMGLSPAALTAE